MSPPPLQHHLFVGAREGPLPLASELAEALHAHGVVEQPCSQPTRFGYLPLGRLTDPWMLAAFRENVWGGFGSLGQEPDEGYDELSAVLVVPEQPLSLYEGSPAPPARRCPRCGRVKTSLLGTSPLEGAPLRSPAPACLFCGEPSDADWEAAEPEPAFHPTIDLQLFLGEVRYFLEPFRLLAALPPERRALLEALFGGPLQEHTEVL